MSVLMVTFVIVTIVLCAIKIFSKKNSSAPLALLLLDLWVSQGAFPVA